MSLLDDALPHLPRLRRHARLLTGDAARADDLLQDTLERAALKAALWRPDPAQDDRSGALRAWLLTLMHRLFLNQTREQRAHLHDSLDQEPDGASEPAAPAGSDPQQRVPLRLDLERALARLTAPAREVLLLVCVEELSYEEAAKVLDLPVGTVMSRLARARERLRLLLSPPEPQTSPGAAAPTLRVVK